MASFSGQSTIDYRPTEQLTWNGRIKVAEVNWMLVNVFDELHQKISQLYVFVFFLLKALVSVGLKI